MENNTNTKDNKIKEPKNIISGISSIFQQGSNKLSKGVSSCY